MQVVILGNGVTGISAALEIRRLQPSWKLTVVSGESTYHWSRPALMYVFMGHMRYQETKPFPDSLWADKRIDLVRGWVAEIDKGARRLLLADGGSIAYDKLLIASGSTSNRFGWPGQDLRGVQGLYGLQDLKALYENMADTRQAVVVGGGLIGIELAEMLHSRNLDVTLLVRERSYWNNVLNEEESRTINRVIRDRGVTLELETTLASIEGDGRGRCAAAVTDDGRRFACGLIGLTAGVSPNVDLVRVAGIAVGRGVLVDRRLRTGTADVWAAGDCAEILTEGDARNLIQQVWYTGKLQGEAAAADICGVGYDYDPGIWFNSAKFFDVEYQTYGKVHMKLAGERNLYWEHPSGRHAARIVYTADGVVGLQTLGLRWRHVVAERWLRERRSVTDVLGNLAELAFDPEFHRRHAAEIVSSFREQLS